MKALFEKGTITIGDTAVYYEVEINIEEETYEVPGSTDISITKLEFEDGFNPYEIEIKKEFTVKPGQTFAEIIEKNLNFITINGKDVHTEVSEHAMENI